MKWKWLLTFVDFLKWVSDSESITVMATHAFADFSGRELRTIPRCKGFIRSINLSKNHLQVLQNRPEEWDELTIL
jgi:hypothetical protein